MQKVVEAEHWKEVSTELWRFHLERWTGKEWGADGRGRIKHTVNIGGIKISGLSLWGD